MAEGFIGQGYSETHPLTREREREREREMMGKLHMGGGYYTVLREEGN